MAQQPAPTRKLKFRSKATVLMRETWRKAWRKAQENGFLEIVFQTESQAHKARMDLYKVVQEEKKGQGNDLELIEASQSIEIVFGASKNILLMRHRGQGAIIGALQEATGLNLETVVDADLAAEVEASLAALQKIPELASNHKPNPFYDRSKE